MAEKDIATHIQQVDECVAFLRDTLPFLPRIVIQLGTGLGDFVEKIEDQHVLPYEDIPHFPTSTVTSHAGNLVLGRLAGEPVICLQGRFHFYEGYSTRELTFPIRVLSLLGAEILVITNAAGGLNPIMAPGTIMVIRDHLNFLGENPLRGPNVDEWGPRFPDLSVPYHPALVKTALDSAAECKITKVFSGTYVCIPGPSLETPAETRWLRDSGADGVGMSTVPEVLVARHAGMEVLGLSVVSNVNNPDNFQPILIEDILAAAAEVTPQLQLLVMKIIENLREVKLS